jgi:dihydroorotate dehydrogenase electron transfer subunit
VTTLLAEAELVESRAVLPGQWIASFHAPAVASGARAGQFVHLRPAGPVAEILRRPVPLNTVDHATGIVSLHLRSGGRGGSAAGDVLDRLRPGDRVELGGPFGRPFEVDPRSRHLLLIAGGMGIARIRMLVDEAVRDGRQITLLYGTSSARAVYPSSLLPDEVEYVVATEDGSLGHHGPVTDLMAPYEAWADQAFAAGPTTMLSALARLASGRRDRLGVATLGRKHGAGRIEPSGSTASRRKAFLQVALDQAVGCAAATCLGCAVIGKGGAPLRVCREGPVFGADELEWDEPR